MQKFLVLLVVGFSCLNINAKGPTLHWLEGTWEGTGTNVLLNYGWTITLSYKADDKSIKLTYPSHNCGGSLKIITIETGKAVCIEDVNYGLGDCITGLDVTIVQESDGSITVTYYQLGSKVVQSVAKLKRK